VIEACCDVTLKNAYAVLVVPSRPEGYATQWPKSACLLRSCSSFLLRDCPSAGTWNLYPRSTRCWYWNM